MSRIYQYVPGTILDEGSLSSVIELAERINGSLQITTAWTVAAGISFQGSSDLSAGFFDIYDDLGVEILIPSHATHTGRVYELSSAVMNFRWIKVRSGTAATPVAQTSGPYTVHLCLKS